MHYRLHTLRQRIRLTRGCLGACWRVLVRGPEGYARSRRDAYGYLFHTLRWTWTS
jgi:hypothetical protein